MSKRIEKAAVLGSGVMGSGIAAHLAGAGIPTVLLDIVPPDLGDHEKSNASARNRFAETAIKKALKLKPAPFYDPDAARRITVGNLEDDLELLRDCDFVVEVVVEKMDIKTSLYKKIAPFLNDDVLLASNTSGLSIAEMSEALPANLRSRFLVTHFFNPVRYMKLLEIVPGPQTEPSVVAAAARFATELGKGVVYGKDTCNFVANRIGVYSMMQAIHALDDGYTIEEIDKIAGRPTGRPKSAAFRTADIVGLDTLVHVAEHCHATLTDDEERDVFKVPDWVREMIQSGKLGQKSGAGFYRKEGKEILVLDHKTLDYRPQEKVKFESIGDVRGIEETGPRLKALIGKSDRAAEFAWRELSRTLVYSANRMGEIADDVVNVDRALRWGYNWDLGPFEIWDAFGVAEATERMKKDGLSVPEWVTDMVVSGRASFYEGPHASRTYFDVGSKKAASIPRDPNHLQLAALKEDKKNIVKENLGASIVDLGDGCLCLEVHTKMNTVDGDVIDMLNEAVDEAERNYEALVIGNDGEHFSAGANLMLVYMAAQQQKWDEVGMQVTTFQNANQRLRYAKVPVVAAPFQYTFGGGAEISMSADAIQAHAETYIGLVEVGVGVVPAATGCLRMMERWTGDVAGIDGVDMLPFVGQASLNIAMAKVATGAFEARRLRYLLPSDGVSLHRDYLLQHAKQRALGMARAGYRPPEPTVLKVAGVDAERTLHMRIWSLVEGGHATEHDGLIARKLAHILCGGEVAAGTERTEQQILDLEREAFLSLCGEEKSMARMQSILMTNKPLRN